MPVEKKIEKTKIALKKVIRSKKKKTPTPTSKSFSLPCFCVKFLVKCMAGVCTGP